MRMLFGLLLVCASTASAVLPSPQVSQPSRPSPLDAQAVPWSFVAPVCPPLPLVRNQRWVRNPIDRFVLARLEREGIVPSPEADRRNLVCGLSVDLMGFTRSLGQVCG